MNQPTAATSSCGKAERLADSERPLTSFMARAGAPALAPRARQYSVPWRHVHRGRPKPLSAKRTRASKAPRGFPARRAFLNHERASVKSGVPGLFAVASFSAALPMRACASMPGRQLRRRRAVRNLALASLFRNALGACARAGWRDYTCPRAAQASAAFWKPATAPRPARLSRPGRRRIRSPSALAACASPCSASVRTIFIAPFEVILRHEFGGLFQRRRTTLGCGGLRPARPPQQQRAWSRSTGAAGAAGAPDSTGGCE